MTALYSDTHPPMEAWQIGLWRQASPTRKMQMLAQLHAAARTLALAGLRSRFPNANEAELRYRLAVLLFGEELAQKSTEAQFMQKDTEFAQRGWTSAICGRGRVTHGD